jgi:hypothetical protein
MSNTRVDACIPIMDESRQLLVSTIHVDFQCMLVPTLCTRPAAKLLVSIVQYMHAPALHNMVAEKMETAAIFHILHSKVSSIVLFVI